jgi:hypothetical protein
MNHNLIMIGRKGHSNQQGKWDERATIGSAGQEDGLEQ